jgi:AcrR family transcriptional regulator
MVLGEQSGADISPGVREKILESTFALRVEDGRDAATIKGITSAAGVASSSVYWLFKDKETVVLEAVEHGTLQWLSRMLPLPEPSGDLGGSVYALMRHLTDDFSERIDFWRVGLQLSLSSTAGVVAHSVRGLRARTGAEIAAWWRAAARASGLDLEAQSAEALARLTMSVVGALLISRRADGEFNARIRDIGREAGRALAVLAGRLVREPDGLAEEVLAAGGVAQVPRVEFVRGADVRERIFAATLAVLAEEGYRSATIARITKRAGVSSSSIYWLCSGKDDLVRRAVQWACDDWYSTVPACLPSAGPGEWTSYLAEQIDRYLASNLHSPNFILGGLQLMLDGVEDGPVPGALVLYREIRVAVRERMARWLDEVVLRGAAATAPEAGTLALLLLTLMDETFTQFMIDQPTAVPRRHIRMVVRLLEALAAGT